MYGWLKQVNGTQQSVCLSLPPHLNVLKCIWACIQTLWLAGIVFDKEQDYSRKCWRRQMHALAISRKKPNGLTFRLCFRCWFTSVWLGRDLFSIHFSLNLFQGEGKLCWAGRYETSSSYCQEYAFCNPFFKGFMF